MRKQQEETPNSPQEVDLSTMSSEQLEKVFEENLDWALNYIRSVLIKKNRSYGSSSFTDGKYSLIGNYFRQADKINRHRQIVHRMIDSGEDFAPFGEDIFEAVRDETGYGLIGLVICKLMGKVPEREHEDYADQSKSNSANYHSKSVYATRVPNGLEPLAKEIENLYLGRQVNPESLAEDIGQTLSVVLDQLEVPAYGERFADRLIEVLARELTFLDEE